MLWQCRKCPTAYAVGLPACPACGSREIEQKNVPGRVDPMVKVKKARKPGGRLGKSQVVVAGHETGGEGGVSEVWGTPDEA